MDERTALRVLYAIRQDRADAMPPGVPPQNRKLWEASMREANTTMRGAKGAGGTLRTPARWASKIPAGLKGPGAAALLGVGALGAGLMHREVKRGKQPPVMASRLATHRHAQNRLRGPGDTRDAPFRKETPGEAIRAVGPLAPALWGGLGALSGRARGIPGALLGGGIGAGLGLGGALAARTSKRRARHGVPGASNYGALSGAAWGGPAGWMLGAPIGALAGSSGNRQYRRGIRKSEPGALDSTRDYTPSQPRDKGKFTRGGGAAAGTLAGGGAISPSRREMGGAAGMIAGGAAGLGAGNLMARGAAKMRRAYRTAPPMTQLGLSGTSAGRIGRMSTSRFMNAARRLPPGLALAGGAAGLIGGRLLAKRSQGA